MQIEDEYVYINCGFLQIFLQKNPFEKKQEIQHGDGGSNSPKHMQQNGNND
jgi:hypothetical protein